MKSYYRVMLGKGSVHAGAAHQGGFIGTDFLPSHDLTGRLPEDWKDFNHAFRPIYQQERPDKNKIAAGLACGFLHTVSKGIKDGDLVLCPDGDGRYLVGEVSGPYYYRPGEVLPHRRPVTWRAQFIDRADMSPALKGSAGSTGTVSNLTKHAGEIEGLLASQAAPAIVATDGAIEDPATFALEKHLEDFLVANWSATALGKSHDIFTEDGEMVGRQYPSDTGPIDILAIRKDGKELLVVELKRGRASDVVVGQILRYMGYVQAELAEEGQTVRGAIIALEDDTKLRRALSLVPSVDFYRYQVSFSLTKG
jgi:restriction system protein